jgi:sugar-specific transcriptional regulator TrmB
MDRVLFFRDLGFSEYEARVLACLIRLRKTTPKEVSLDSGVPQNKLYSILREFEKEGILALVNVEPKKYELINFNSYIISKIKEKEDKLRELKESSKSLDKMKDKEEQFIFSLIKGQKAIMNKIIEVNEQVTKEIFGVQRNWKYWAEGIREMQKVVKRRVDVRLIGVVNEETIERVREWKKTGAKIRIFNSKFGSYPPRFTVFDNKYVRITLGKPEIRESKDYITIWTDSKPLVRMLRRQFLQMWKESKKF